MLNLLNRVVLIGRLTRDPELRYTNNGTAVTTFTLAVERPFTNSSGEKETDFLNIVVWRQLAETCANYLKKGRLCAVDGRIQTRSYDNQEGRKVYVTEILAESVRFLEWGDTQSNGNSKNRNLGDSSSFNSDPFDGETIDISDDDLPF